MSNRQVELVVRRAGNPEQRLFLSPGVTHMGRAEDNDLVLADIGVSRRHARIIVNESQVRYEDLGSGNGSFVRGRRVDRHVVGSGDEVVIDPFQLTFRFHGSRGPVPEDDETVRAPEADLLESAPGRLVVLAGHRLAAAYPVTSAPLSLGRSEVRDVVLFDPAASRDHAAIEMRADGFWLIDRGSANGTYANELRVAGSQQLASGDRIRIGATEFRFEMGGTAAAPAPVFDIPPPVLAPPPVAPHPVMPAPAPVAALAPAPVAAPMPTPVAPPPQAPPARIRAVSSPPLPRSSRGGLTVLVAVAGFLIVALGGAVVVGGLLFWKYGGLPTNVPTPPGVGEVYTPTVGTEAEVDRLLAHGAQHAGQGRYLEAASKYYKIHKIDNGHPEARWRGYLACELVAFDVLARDLTSRDITERSLRKEVRSALVNGQKAIDGERDIAEAYDAVLGLMKKLPENTDLAQMARRLQSAAAEFVRSDEGKKLQKRLVKDIQRGFGALDGGDLDAAESAFGDVIDEDSRRQTPQYYRAQEGLRVVESRRNLGG